MKRTNGSNVPAILSAIPLNRRVRGGRTSLVRCPPCLYVRNVTTWRASLTLSVLVLAALLQPGAAAAGEDPFAADRPQLLALAAADARIARIGLQLAEANAALCDQQMPATGLVVHSLGQYPASLHPALKAVLGFGAPLSVEAVIPGSAAARAGVRAGDGIVALDGTALAPVDLAGGQSADRDGFEAALIARSPAVPVVLALVRGGAPITAPLMNCAPCLQKPADSRPCSTARESFTAGARTYLRR